LMFESHRPFGRVFACPWKCTLSKGTGVVNGEKGVSEQSGAER